MLTVRVNVTRELARFKKFGPEGRVELRDFMRRHGRALISSSGSSPGVVQLTPPFNKGVRGSAAKKQGQQAITNDLLGKGRTGQRSGGVFTVMDDALLANAHVNSTGTVRLFARKDGTVYGTDRRHFRPRASNSEMYAHHQSMRMGNGRVTKAGGFTRDIGRWKFIDHMVVGVSAFKRYQRMIHARVGMLAAALVSIAEARLGPLKGIPAWVRRHAGNVGGSGNVSLSESSSGITITAIVSSPRAPRDMQRRMDYAAGYRLNAMRADLPRTAKRLEAKLQQGLPVS